MDNLKFDDIDVTQALAAVTEAIEQRERLTNPTSKTADAKERLDTATAQLAKLRRQRDERNAYLGAYRRQRDDAVDARHRADARVTSSPAEEHNELAKNRFPLDEHCNPADLIDRERQANTAVDKTITDLSKQLNTLNTKIVRQMGKAKGTDTGELLEVGTELVDLPAYLSRLRVLAEEALPKRKKKFIRYLNESSDQGVSSLLESVEAEVGAIISRIDELNITLAKVNYQPGRYLALRPRKVSHHALQELERARKNLARARLTDDQGETQYAALKNVIDLLAHASDNRSSPGARAVLDPRHRLTFAVAVIERATGETVEVRTSSEGGSGGEKEIIASYILTASLSYALSPDGATQPLFGTIVLDEAFSKSSQTVAARIIDALNVFGLHPLFVTPNKELSLLRSNTNSAILVNRKGSKAKLSALSWEELDQRTQGQSHPVKGLGASNSSARSPETDATPATSQDIDL